MNTDWHALIQRYISGTITDAEAEALERELSTNASLRDWYLDAVNLDSALEAAAEMTAMEQTIMDFEQRQTVNLSAWARFSLAALPLGAAAAAAAVIFLPFQKPIQTPRSSDAEQVARIIFQKQFPDSH